MASGGWVAELDKKEHKNWVMVGCALNITKNGMTSKIQKEMEAWYQSLISSPPLRSLPSCTCAPGAPTCVTCVTWESELTRHHISPRPKICWNNGDRKQWGSPTGSWEIAKVFMPTLGSRKMDVIDAESTDIGGLLNLLEWCPFINPPLSRAVLSSARDKCRNHWAHAPKQELQDADVLAIFGHLNSLLSDPVFIADKAAQKALIDLQDLFHQGLMNVRISEVEALYLLRQSLVADLTKCQGELTDVRNEVAQLNTDAEKVKEQSVLVKEEICKLRTQTRDVQMTTQKNVSLLKEQGDLNKEEIYKLRQRLDEKATEVKATLSDDISTVLHAVGDFNKLLNQRGDLEEAFEVICDNVEGLTNGLKNAVVELKTTKSQVANLEINFASIKCEVEDVANKAATNKKMIAGLQKDVMEVKEEVEALKGNASQGENGDDGDILCTAPSRLTSFTGRKSALEWLETNVVPKSPESGQETSCCIKTICGLGGCGKTSLAVEFAWSCKARFPGGVFWINGESDENIRKSVVEILALVNITASTTENIDDTLNRFLAWLSKKKHPWLLVVDNADELQDSTCPTGIKKICRGPWERNVNASKHGHILLTTRQNAKDTRTFFKLSGNECMELQCFSEEEGAFFLMQKTGLKGESLDPEAILLAKELGALPLALEQAAAFISASPIPLSFKDYLEQYQAVKVRLLKQQSVTALSMEGQHRLSVHTTWEMNFAYVKEKSPAAASMMRIAAFLASENVPVDVINPGFPELEQEDLRECARSKIDIAVILKVLSSYSLFSVDHQTRAFSVHKLVQEVVRESLTVSQRIEAMVAATRVLHSALVTNIAPSSKLTKKQDLEKNLSEVKEKERNILIALVLNFHKLKNHMEDEINSSKGNSAFTLYNNDTFNLCTLVCDLIGNNVFFKRLKAELDGFRLNISQMPCTFNPVLLLEMMVNTSVSLRNCPGNEKYDEARKLAQETVQKLTEMEKSAIFITSHTKYRVREHMASYYALEGQWEKNYKALLELESLPLSDEDTVDLQILIGRAENYMSASNFQCVLGRYLKALKLARHIYPSDHVELLRVLQFITVHFYNEGKLEKARIYAEETLQIAKKQPPESGYYLKGITSALSVMCFFDPNSAEDTLLGVLEDRWPLVYRSIRSGVIDGHIHTSNESSYEHAAMVLEGLMQCFVVVSNFSTQEKKTKFKEQKGHFYRSIGEMLLSLRRKIYVESHQEVQDAYDYLVEVHKFLGNHEEADKLKEKMGQCNEKGVSNRSVGIPYCDSRVIFARKFKDDGNVLFKSGNYSRALEFYSQALNQCPNDAKLLTNRAAANVKLSEQHAQSRAADEQRKFLEYALQDSNKAITADPTWVKGYHWRAVCLAKLGQRGPSLAAAAVAKHLFPSQCVSQIPAVVEKFGNYNARVVTTVKDLVHAIERTEKNLVILVKEGRYELLNPLNAPTNAVIVGLDNVEIICTKGVPLQLDKAVYKESITLSPTMESITKLKKKAKECLNRGELDEALSLYSNALTTCPNNPQLLTTKASTYLKLAEQKKNIPSERKPLLELAMKDCEVAIKADPSWLLSYSTKALVMVELDRRNQALAAAAVFMHLSSGRDIAAVSRHYGELQVHVVESSDELRSVLQGITELKGVNQVVLIKEGEYVVEKSVQIKPPIVVAGMGKVTVSCNTGPPLHFTQEHFVENVELCGTCGKQPESQESASSNDDNDQPEVISLAAPSGYENAKVDSECKGN